jgi:CHAD domain-containing protein
MRDHVRQETALLLGRLTEAVNRAASGADEQSIHDVRVAMRRLRCCLRAFAPFYPRAGWKKIRRRLASLMAVAGAVRDCDIALELAGRAGFTRRSALVSQLAAQRRAAGRDLLLEIRRWRDRDYPRRWHGRLELKP